MQTISRNRCSRTLLTVGSNFRRSSNGGRKAMSQRFQENQTRHGILILSAGPVTTTGMSGSGTMTLTAKLIGHGTHVAIGIEIVEDITTETGIVEIGTEIVTGVGAVTTRATVRHMTATAIASAAVGAAASAAASAAATDHEHLRPPALPQVDAIVVARTALWAPLV